MQRYLSFNQAMKEKFGKKVYKLCLDAGMTCPNRDGTLGKRGCIFCDGGSGAFSVQRQESLDKQIALAKQRVKQKLTADTSFIAYFQSYTNTYASIEHLQKIFFRLFPAMIFAQFQLLHDRIAWPMKFYLCFQD